MITLDASIVIAHLQPRDTQHAAATAYLRGHADQPLLIHSLNLAEVLVGGVRAGRGQDCSTTCTPSAYGLPCNTTGSLCDSPPFVWRPD